MRQDRFLLSNVALQLTLTRAKPEFTLIANTAVAGACIRITSAKWYVKRVELTPGAIDATVVKMTNENALYPIDRIMYVSKHTTGITSWELNDIWAGPMPNHVILGIVKASAVDGMSIVGSTVAREMLSTLEISGKAWRHVGNLIDFSSYVGGNAIYTFDLTADGSHGLTHWSLTNRGAITISVTFANAPADPVTVIVIGLVSTVI